jgi:hypothetical protein
VAHVVEPLMQDLDGSFEWTGSQPSNGMTRARFPDDDPRCVVFDWANASRGYELELPSGAEDLTDDAVLSFRAAQGTRHPETDALDAPLSFTVRLRDGGGNTSRIDFGTWGRIPRPYERTGAGPGAGWQNEFATVRIRIADFLANGSALDLTDVRDIRLEFGPGSGAPRGRLALDDVELVRPFVPPPFVLSVEAQGGSAVLTWPARVGALRYDVYRGTIPLAGVLVYDHVCFSAADAEGDGHRVAIDGDPVPPSAAGYYYLVAATLENGESSLGRSSVDLDPGTAGDQLERPNAAPCP